MHDYLEKPGKYICWLSTNHKQTRVQFSQISIKVFKTLKQKSRERIMLLKFFKNIFRRYKILQNHVILKVEMPTPPS